MAAEIAGTGAELLRRLSGELDVVLVGGDRLVLGAVVLKDALDVLELTDQQERVTFILSE